MAVFRVPTPHVLVVDLSSRVKKAALLSEIIAAIKAETNCQIFGHTDKEVVSIHNAEPVVFACPFPNAAESSEEEKTYELVDGNVIHVGFPACLSPSGGDR